jgi:oligopeptide/dipeptide ABC transporter ATP-binding protein
MTTSSTASAANGDALVRVSGLEKRFHARGATVFAVNGVDFEIVRGETVALVGESGCGKSTVARCLVRLLEPDGGAIVFDGQDVTRLPERDFRPLRRRMQIVFQDPTTSLNRSFSIRRTLREPLRLHDLVHGRADEEARLADLMRHVQLDPRLLDRRPHELSGGQRQRVGIARAIATEPSFVVLDEPTSSLDMSLRQALLELLAELQRELGMTYLFITHDFGTVRRLGGRIVVMYLGEVMETGDARTVLEAPLHPYTQALVAAIPEPDPHRRRERVLLPGETPTALSKIVGCPFQDRCPAVMPACRERPIPLFHVDGRDVACLLYERSPPACASPATDSTSSTEGATQP